MTFWAAHMDQINGCWIGSFESSEYTLERRIGAGPICLVYEALDLRSNRKVALKLLFREFSKSARHLDSIQRAFTGSRRVNHRNVSSARDLIQEGDAVGYTMELAQADLASLLAPELGPPSISKVVGILHQLSLGLQSIHDADLTHRNIKPENILLFHDGTFKIADFQTACSRDGLQRYEEQGGVVGAVDYVAPEYMLRSQVDWRADIYGVGVLAFELLTGRAPFVGNSVYATMTKRLKSDPEPPLSLRPDCPKQLNDIIVRAMKRDPLDRYQAASEMADELAELMTSVEN